MTAQKWLETKLSRTELTAESCESQLNLSWYINADYNQFLGPLIKSLLRNIVLVKTMKVVETETDDGPRKNVVIL